MDRKIVVITGSSKGIGFHLARHFLKKGHQLVINGRNEKKLESARKELLSFGEGVHACPGDVSNKSTHEILIKEAIDHYGRIDIWINNAGIPQPYQLFHEIEIADIEKLIGVNLTGTAIGTNFAINFFLKQGFGTLYNMEGFGSDGRMMNKLSLYGTSKRAVSYFSKAVSKEFTKSNIRIGTINPGMVRTDFVEIDRGFDSEPERKKYEKVLKILAEDPDPVSLYIVSEILKNKKSFHAVKFLSGWKLAGKIIRLSFT